MVTRLTKMLSQTACACEGATPWRSSGSMAAGLPQNVLLKTMAALLRLRIGDRGDDQNTPHPPDALFKRSQRRQHLREFVHKGDAAHVLYALHAPAGHGHFQRPHGCTRHVRWAASRARGRGGTRHPQERHNGECVSVILRGGEMKRERVPNAPHNVGVGA